MIIHSYENTPRADACINYVRRCSALEKVDQLFLLPIPSTRNNDLISGTNVYIYDVLEGVTPASLIVGYGLSDEFVGEAIRQGCVVFDISKDEGFLCENAELTAIATLGILLTTFSIAPSNMKVGVVGYGRIGKRLTKLLLYLGSQVRVYTSNNDVQMDLCECGVETLKSSSCADVNGLDILINTAPAKIFDTGRAEFPRHLRVIDLASGDNFPDFQVEKYPSVPAKMFPLTAGLAWGKSIERFLMNNRH